MAIEMPISDGRLRGGSPKVRYTPSENDGTVFKIVNMSPTPLSITSITKQMTHVTERTVRRSVDRLIGEGFLTVAGKDGKTILYAAKSAMFVPDMDTAQKLLPFNGATLSVSDFLELLVNPESDPFAMDLKLQVLDVEFVEWLRKRFIYAVITAGDSGYNAQLMRQRESLMKLRAEIQRLADNLDKFVNSPVWYDHYRDRIAFNRREVEQSNPDLVQMARDYLQNNT